MITTEIWGGVEYEVYHAEDPQTIFDQLNTKFWGGKLPSYRVVYDDGRHRLPEFSDDGCWVLGGVWHDERLIMLRSPQDSRQLVRSILHEACHVATRDELEDHGPRFRRELARVMR